MLCSDSDVLKTSPLFNSRIAKDEEEMCVYHFEILHLTVLVLQADQPLSKYCDYTHHNKPRL